MSAFRPTIILRHRKENLSKCSLRGIEEREDVQFFSYPWKVPQPDLTNYVVLTPYAPELCKDDAEKGIFLIDGTWRYAKRMIKTLTGSITYRSLPDIPTAYPRRQKVERGLASIEALYLAYLILGLDPKGLLDHYYWKERFLTNIQGAFPLADML